MISMLGLTLVGIPLIVFALGFWMLQLTFSKLAGIYRFDYRIAYAMPPLIMLLVSYLLFRRRSG